MNRNEATKLLAVVGSFDRRYAFRDQAEARMAAEAWLMVLEDIRYEDAVEAVRRHYSGSGEYLMPAQVRSTVRNIRAARIDNGPRFDPSAYGIDPDDVTRYLEAKRAHETAVADGVTPPTPPEVEGRKVAPDTFLRSLDGVLPSPEGRRRRPDGYDPQPREIDR